MRHGLRQGHSATFPRFSNSVAYYGLAMDLQKFGLSIYLVQALFGIIDIPAMLVATTTMIYVGRRATVSSFLILAGLMVIANMFMPEGESSLPPCGGHVATGSRSGGRPSGEDQKYTYYSNPWKAEAGESSVLGQPGNCLQRNKKDASVTMRKRDR